MPRARHLHTGPWTGSDLKLEWPDGVPDSVQEQFMESRAQGAKSVWFTYGSWYLRVGLEEVRGRIEAVQAEALAGPRRKVVPLTSTQLRAIPWATIIDEAKRHYLDAIASFSAPARYDDLDPVTALPRAGEQRTGRQDAFWVPRVAAAERGVVAGAGGRPAVYGPEHWEKVARVYATAVADGDRKPTQAVRRAFKGATPDQVGKWVAKCRAMKLLPPAPAKGVSGMKVQRTTKGREGAS